MYYTSSVFLLIKFSMIKNAMYYTSSVLLL